MTGTLIQATNKFIAIDLKGMLIEFVIADDAVTTYDGRISKPEELPLGIKVTVSGNPVKTIKGYK